VWRTDGQTELRYQYRVSVCWRTIKLKQLMIMQINVQILELSTVRFDRWMKLGCGSWILIVFSCWIALTPTMHLSLSLLVLQSDVSRGHRENTLSTLYSHVTATASCLSFSLGEVLRISTTSSKFSLNIRHTWCHCWWLMEVRHFVNLCEYKFVAYYMYIFHFTWHLS